MNLLKVQFLAKLSVIIPLRQEYIYSQQCFLARKNSFVWSFLNRDIFLCYFPLPAVSCKVVLQKLHFALRLHGRSHLLEEFCFSL